MIQYQAKYDKSLVEKTLLDTNIKNAVDKLEALEERKGSLESARDVVNEVLCLTQNEVKSYIEEVVSLALSIVHGSEYAFEIDYNVKRNQSEAYFYFVKNGEKFAPDFESGGGVMDTASFALRIVFYSLMSPKPAPIFILDEPAKHLSHNLQEAYGKMLSEISELMGVQIVIISQSRECLKEADKTYHVFRENDISYAEEVYE